MKRLLIGVLLVLASSSAAQENWFGLRSGYPLGGTLHYGIKNGLSGGYDLRVSANLRLRNSEADFGMGVDGLNTLYRDLPLELYVGGGPALDFGGGGLLLDVPGLVGSEFRFYDVGLSPLGMFAEISVGAAIGLGRASVVPSVGGSVGINWHF